MPCTVAGTDRRWGRAGGYSGRRDTGRGEDARIHAGRGFGGVRLGQQARQGALFRIQGFVPAVHGFNLARSLSSA